MWPPNFKKDETTYTLSAGLRVLREGGEKLHQSVTRGILQGLVKMSASMQTNLQSCQKAGSTQELPTNYLPETEKDIPGSCLTSAGLTCYFRLFENHNQKSCNKSHFRVCLSRSAPTIC